jgi:cholesterol oxidase
VILGAGSIGSNEIMLRSRGCGMELSDRIGYQWTMNGDALGFVRKSRYLTNSGGVSAYRIKGKPVGPTIQTNLTYPNRPSLTDRVLIQDGSVTRAYATVLGGLMADFDLDQTMVLLGMGHDDSSGRVTLGGDGMGAVSWKGIKESVYRRRIRNEFARIAKAHGGTYKYLKIFGDNFITVHPLGGCALADDPASGVVNDFGQVFDGTSGGWTDNASGEAAVHQGFYVADGSIIPSAIACNPLLTISAIAERIAENIVIDPQYKDIFGASEN